MKSKILGLLAVALLAGPITGSASVFYEFSGNTAPGNPFTFVYEAPGFISSPTTLETPTFINCGPINCLRVVFEPDGTFRDRLVFTTVSDGTFTHAFQNGAFGAFGTYTSVAPSGGSLVVRSGHAVPEPGTLALLGLGLAGLGLSRRRKAA